MDVVELKNAPGLKRIVEAVGSKKRKCIVARPRTEVELSMAYWDQGSRSDYFIVDLATMTATPLPHYSPPQFGGPKQAPVQALEPGYAVVEAGVFCGKLATPTIFLHPAQEEV